MTVLRRKEKAALRKSSAANRTDTKASFSPSQAAEIRIHVLGNRFHGSLHVSMNRHTEQQIQS